MSKLRIIDDLLEQMLQEDDLVTNKASGATYIVKKVNPLKHTLVKPKLSPKEIQSFEAGRQKEREQQGKKELQQITKAEPDVVKAVTKIPVPKDIGPETPAQAVGSNPKAEKKLATRMAQLGQASAKYITAVKDATNAIKQQHPDYSDDELSKAAKAEVKKRGILPPPSYDLCTVSIPGTNLFCGGNKEIPRDQMPQLKTKAVPGSAAWKQAEKLAKEKGIDPKDVEVNAEPAFLEYLTKEGVKIQRGKMPATQMKATQNQLNADKVAGMAWALYNDPKTKDASHPLRQPLIVSNDGYVLDGHHRWAALATHDVMSGNKDVSDIPVIRVDMDIEDLVDKSNEFGDQFGLARKGMGAGAEGTGKTGKEAPKANKTSKPNPQQVETAKNTLTDKVKETFKDFAKNSKETAADILQTAKSFDKNDWLDIIFGGAADALKSSGSSKSSSGGGFSGFGGGRSGGGGASSSF